MGSALLATRKRRVAVWMGSFAVVAAILVFLTWNSYREHHQSGYVRLTPAEAEAKFGKPEIELKTIHGETYWEYRRVKLRLKLWPRPRFLEKETYLTVTFNRFNTYAQVEVYKPR